MMDDLISRQAAIDALMTFKDAHKADRYTGDFLHWTGVRAMIENLPSVQTREVECKKCYWSDEKGCSIFCRAWNRYTAHGGYCHQYADRRGDNNGSD